MEGPLPLETISIVIPVFNEEKNLPPLFAELERFKEALQETYSAEIIVVDDGSHDGSPNIAKSHGAMVINSKFNRGKGHALRQGFEKARGNIILTMDGDFSHRPLDGMALLNRLKKDRGDMVIGTRFGPDFEDGAIPSVHMVGNRLIRILSLLLFQRYIVDSQSGFRAFRRELLGKIHLSSDGFTIDSELTFKALRAGARVVELPIACRRRIYGRTRIRTFKDGFQIILTLIKVALRT